MVMYYHSPDNYGCMTCGSSNCGEFTCWTEMTAAEERRRRRIELREAVANRLGRFSPRYLVSFRLHEHNRVGYFVGEPSSQSRFYSWHRARRYAVDLGLDADPEWLVTIWDRELQMDVTYGPAPASAWPRPADSWHEDDLPF